MKRWTVWSVVMLLAMAAAYARPAPCQDAELRIKVLTFNVWGIISAKQRVVRARAIGEKIAALDPDVVAIEEAFERRHRAVLMRALRDKGYQVVDWRYFRNIYGSGVFFISKYPIEESYFEPYRVLGGPTNIEWLGGKGIACLRLRTPWGPLEFFSTHAIARMTAIFDASGNYIPGDPQEVDRFLNMYQIDRFVRAHRDPFGRSIIMAGDFNVSPEMPEYRFLVAKTGFESSFELLHPGENPSTFSKQDVWVKDEYSRIDHIYFKNYMGSVGFWVKPVESHVTMNEKFTSPKNKKEINYSDHYGLWTEFEVVTDPAAVTPSPEGAVPSPCKCAQCPLPIYTLSQIRLTPENYPAWKNAALAEFSRAFTKHDRRDSLLIPMAAIVAAGPVTQPVTVDIPPKDAARFKKDVCHDICVQQ